MSGLWHAGRLAHGARTPSAGPAPPFWETLGSALPLGPWKWAVPRPPGGRGWAEDAPASRSRAKTSPNPHHRVPRQSAPALQGEGPLCVRGQDSRAGRSRWGAGGESRQWQHTEPLPALPATSLHAAPSWLPCSQPLRDNEANSLPDSSAGRGREAPHAPGLQWEGRLAAVAGHRATSSPPLGKRWRRGARQSQRP